jgi:hypothetical protein
MALSANNPAMCWQACCYMSSFESMLDGASCVSSHIHTAVLTCKAAEVVNACLVVHCKHTTQALRPPFIPLLLVRLRSQTSASSRCRWHGFRSQNADPVLAVASCSATQRVTFQSNKGLPHSWPVSEKASGGTPETCAGAPAAANSRAWSVEGRSDTRGTWHSVG